MGQRYFEDISAEETHALGSWSVSKDEIIQFAEQYDPQPIHTDEAAARESLYGGLIASGWQTVALTMRTMVDGFLRDVASMGARGVDRLRWTEPVRPADTVSTRLRVLETDCPDAESRFGDVRAKTVGTNQDGDDVVSWQNRFIIERRQTE